MLTFTTYLNIFELSNIIFWFKNCLQINVFELGHKENLPFNYLLTKHLSTSLWHWISKIFDYCLMQFFFSCKMFMDYLHELHISNTPQHLNGISIRGLTRPVYSSLLLILRHFLVDLLVSFRPLLCWRIHFWFSFLFWTDGLTFLSSMLRIWCRINSSIDDCKLSRAWGNKATPNHKIYTTMLQS